MLDLSTAELYALMIQLSYLLSFLELGSMLLWEITCIEVEKAFLYRFSAKNNAVIKLSYIFNERSKHILNFVTLYFQCPCYTFHVVTVVKTVKYA